MRLRLFLSILLVALFALPSQSQEEISESEKLRVTELLEYVNSVRSSRGLPLLAGSQALNRAASTHAHEMVQLGYFGHRSPIRGRQTVTQRVEAEGLKADRLTQRIYANYGLTDETLVESCIQDWQGSSRTRRALLSPEVSHLGLGFAWRGEEVFVTQIFAGGWVRPVHGVAQGELRFDTEGCLILADRIFELSNEIRAKYGKPALGRDEVLRQAAVGHSGEMLRLNYFGHYSPNSNRARVRDRVQLAGSDPIMVAENLYQCTGYRPESVPKRAIQAWLESPGHRENLLDYRSDFMGIGVVARGDSVYITQVFGGDGR